MAYVPTFKFSFFFSMKQMRESQKEPGDAKIAAKYWYQHCLLCQEKIFDKDNHWIFANVNKLPIYEPGMTMLVTSEDTLC